MTVAVQQGATREPAPGGSRFPVLSRSPYLDVVVAANRLYLTVALVDALRDERERWALSCLPTTALDDRLSTVSMGGQETFAVLKPKADGVVTAHVLVCASTLLSFDAAFESHGLEISPSPYVAGGPDQVVVSGGWQRLARALASPPLRVAARDFARHLMVARTRYASSHDDALADRVLGRG